jgi:hypothetical protein
LTEVPEVLTDPLPLKPRFTVPTKKPTTTTTTTLKHNELTTLLSSKAEVVHISNLCNNRLFLLELTTIIKERICKTRRYYAKKGCSISGTGKVSST